MTKTKYKNLKPTDFEISLIYKCPKCSIEHWLSIKEAQTNNFKVVCDCDAIFKVKKVKTIKVIYDTEISVQPEIKEPVIVIPEKVQPPDDMVTKVVSVLVQYGFTKTESIELLNTVYNDNQSADLSTIIKLCLSQFGEKTNG